MATLSACWDWKVEPVSPGFASPEHEFDAWTLEDDVTPFAPKPEKDELLNSHSASELLDDIDEWIKEEPFAIWLEEKIDLPIFADIPVPVQEPRAYGQFVRGNTFSVKPPTVTEVKHVLSSPQFVVPDDTQMLLQEFESVFGEVEQNNGTLTPPQSPPQSQFTGLFPQDTNNGEQLLMTTLQQMIPVQSVSEGTFKLAPVTPVLPTMPVIYAEKKDTHLLASLEQIVPSAPMHDIDSEVAAIDELIRTRVEDLETSIPVSAASSVNLWSQDSSPVTTDTSSLASREQLTELFTVTPPSPSTSSNSSSDSGEELCDDPEWIPISVQGPAPGCEKVTGGRKKGSKPYCRAGNEEKRLRKKEQNKNAATRYRQKKKAEVEEILNEEKILADKNEDLQSKVSDLGREIKYLKGLMRDMFMAKGLIK